MRQDFHPGSFRGPSRCWWRYRFTLLESFITLGLIAAPGCLGAGRVQSRPTDTRSHERADFVVAQDGKGDFPTIQQALDAIPTGSNEYRIILIRNGTYREKLFLTKSRLALVGEDREKTKVVYSQLRSEWRANHPDDWGAAVINIANDVTDIVFANLTIRNDFGSSGLSHDHQFAIRSGKGTTRISVLHANIIADGGDTISLWNPASGMYYHADSYFEGFVDFFCPRGWAYAINCRFHSHSTTASIWHDGSLDEEGKLVIRQSVFDGDRDFVLGRNTRDGQFYLIDCSFAQTMADRPIYLARDADTFRWGLRAFFSGCRREGGNYPWFADNLDRAKGSPQAEQIDARWTFAGNWDPEATLPAVLPFASIPIPHHLAHAVPPATSLRFVGARNATAYDICIGSSDPPPRVARITSTSYQPKRLEPNTTYYWRVDTLGPAGIVKGPNWQFSTGRKLKPASTPKGGGG